VSEEILLVLRKGISFWGQAWGFAWADVCAKHRKHTAFELAPIAIATAESPVLDSVSAFNAKRVLRDSNRKWN
jgi:hypothetical protein